MADVLVHDTDEDDCFEHLNMNFLEISEAGLTFMLSMCPSFTRHLQYLAHLISGEGLYPLKEKVASLVNLAPPIKVTKTKHIMGLALYCQNLL